MDKPQNLRGGTYAVGGTTEAWLNITYNYAQYYSGLGAEGLRSLHERPIAEVRQVVSDTMNKLGTNRTEDYWESTAGNAGAALRNLLVLFALCSDTDVVEVR